jgi:hypothetical protein
MSEVTSKDCWLLSVKGAIIAQIVIFLSRRDAITALSFISEITLMILGARFFFFLENKLKGKYK